MKKHNAAYYFRVYRKPTKAFGLKYAPFLVLGGDDKDEVADALPDPLPKEEWGIEHRKLLIATVKALRPNAAIVEIGVQTPENGWNSSTQTIFRSRGKDMKYVGFDWQDRRAVAKDQPNAHVVVLNTRDAAAVEEAIDDAGVMEIDLLVLDGGRSVDQTLCDWQYAERVAKGGFVVIHGTAAYPGPYVLAKAIDDRAFFTLVADTSEYGLTILQRR